MSEPIYELAVDCLDLVVCDGPVWQPKIVCDNSLPWDRWFPNRGPFCRGKMETVLSVWKDRQGNIVQWVLQ